MSEPEVMYLRFFFSLNSNALTTSLFYTINSIKFDVFPSVFAYNQNTFFTDLLHSFGFKMIFSTTQ